MAGATKLGRPAKSEGDNARTLLAAALKEAKAARRAVNRQIEAKQRLFAQQVAAEAAIPAAEKAVAAARTRYVEAVAEAAASGSGEPVSTEAEAMASLAFKRDKIHTLRAARKVVEDEIPGYEEQVVEADTEVDRLISLIIADHVAILLAEAEELSRRLAPYRAALLAFVRDHGDRPSQWDKQRAWDKARAPLNESADQAWAFLRPQAAAPSPCWKAIRESLRANPNAPLLRPLAEEFTGLFDRPTDRQDENHADVAPPT
jgi:hypothetical protein